MTTILVTGGAGFIGSAVIRQFLAETDVRVVNLDALTYAASLDGLPRDIDPARYVLERADIADGAALARIFVTHRPDAVMHLAAETHVDRSIRSAEAFIRTNLVGTFTLLEAARRYYESLGPAERDAFRFHQVSTDEVYGALGPEGKFGEDRAYAPNSPYAASKAGADHLARAWYKTYGLPVIVSNGSNTYGPYQFPEKLIPRLIVRALRGETLPVYGDGGQVREWLHVEDHARALRLVLAHGRVGEHYNIGGGTERTNLQVVEEICRILDDLRPRAAPHRSLVAFVADRPGHDRRYAIDAGKIAAELGWQPRRPFALGLKETVRWYLANEAWWRQIQARGGMSPA